MYDLSRVTCYLQMSIHYNIATYSSRIIVSIHKDISLKWTDAPKSWLGFWEKSEFLIMWIDREKSSSIVQILSETGVAPNSLCLYSLEETRKWNNQPTLATTVFLLYAYWFSLIVWFSLITDSLFRPHCSCRKGRKIQTWQTWFCPDPCKCCSLLQEENQYPPWSTR